MHRILLAEDDDAIVRLLSDFLREEGFAVTAAAGERSAREALERERFDLALVDLQLADGSGFVEIATTRPETLLGDSALAVNPNDERYKDIVGKMDKKPRVIYMTPQGRVFSQEIAEELSKEESLIFLCGHYEGIDERVLDEIVTDHLSIGDYVLTGGELPAMVMIDTIARLVPGVLNNSESAEYDSFQDGLLEYPQYTRPEIWHDKQVPEVLLSGHHGNIEKWRRQQSLKRTFERRPELLEQEKVQEALTKKDREYLSELENPEDTL